MQSTLTLHNRAPAKQVGTSHRKPEKATFVCLQAQSVADDAPGKLKEAANRVGSAAKEVRPQVGHSTALQVCGQFAC